MLEALPRRALLFAPISDFAHYSCKIRSTPAAASSLLPVPDIGRVKYFFEVRARLSRWLAYAFTRRIYPR